jgi:hypothetical protein
MLRARCIAANGNSRPLSSCDQGKTTAWPPHDPGTEARSEPRCQAARRTEGPTMTRIAWRRRSMCIEALAPPTYRRTLRADGDRGRSEVGAGRRRPDRPRSRDAKRYGATMHQAGARSFVTRPRHDWKYFGPKLSKSASDRVTTLPGYLGLLVTGAVGITGNRYASYIDCRTSLLAVGFGANSPVLARCPGRPGALAARWQGRLGTGYLSKSARWRLGALRPGGRFRRVTGTRLHLGPWPVR